MERLKARDSGSSSKYNLENLRRLVLECIDEETESSVLGNWAYEAWHSLSEKNDDRKFMKILMEVSSEWGLMSQTTQEFSKDFLQKMIVEIDDYMNIWEEMEMEG